MQPSERASERGGAGGARAICRIPLCPGRATRAAGVSLPAPVVSTERTTWRPGARSAGAAAAFPSSWGTPRRTSGAPGAATTHPHPAAARRTWRSRPAPPPAKLGPLRSTSRSRARSPNARRRRCPTRTGSWCERAASRPGRALRRRHARSGWPHAPVERALRDSRALRRGHARSGWTRARNGLALRRDARSDGTRALWLGIRAHRRVWVQLPRDTRKPRKGQREAAAAAATESGRDSGHGWKQRRKAIAPSCPGREGGFALNNWEGQSRRSVSTIKTL